MIATALVLTVLGFSTSIVGILLTLDILTVNKPKVDKYEKYRNADGLLGKKKE